MAIEVARVDVWTGSIEDQPGGIAGVLGPLAEAGVNLEFVVARRAPDKPGTGVVFMAPIKGAAQSRVAKKVGLAKATDMAALRLDCADEAGLGAQITSTLAEAGINLRGLSAAAVGKKCVMYVGLDCSKDATKAARLLKKL